jgi:hypothetical protein
MAGARKLEVRPQLGEYQVRLNSVMIEMLSASASRKAPNWTYKVLLAGFLAGCANTMAMQTRDGVRPHAPAPSSSPAKASSKPIATILPSKPTTASTTSSEAPQGDNSEPRTKKASFRLEALRVEFLSDWAILHVSASIGPVEGPEKKDDGANATIELWPPYAALTAFRVKGENGAWNDAKRLGALAADKWFSKAHEDKHIKQGQLFELGTEMNAQELRIRPFAAREPIHIAYDALTPTRYDQGIHELVLSVPEGGKTIAPNSTFLAVASWLQLPSKT